MRRAPRLVMSAVMVLGLVGASCGSDDSDASAVHRDVTVFAAASLTAAFTEIGDAFMVEYPETDVVFSFAGSSDLVAQIGEGAPADVFAAADLSTMAKVTDAGQTASEPQVFATNIAEIIVGGGQPEGDHRRGRSRRRRPDRGPVCGRGAVRQVRRPDLRERRGHGHAEVARGEREGRRHQGDIGRGRRRNRVCDRRDRRGRRRRRCGDPGRHQRGRRVPDRNTRRGVERRRCAGVHRLRAQRAGPNRSSAPTASSLR